MTLIVLAIAWMFGVVAADLLHLPMWPLVGAGVVFGLAAAVLREPRARLAVLALACACLGAARLAGAAVPTTPQSVWLANNTGELSVQGVIIEDPQRSDDGQRVLIAAEALQTEAGNMPADGLVLATLPPFPERRYGDRVVLSGVLKAPRPAKRPGAFDYAEYLARKRIFSLMTPKRVTLAATDQASPFFAGLLGLRDAARRTLLREFPEPQASLAVGILLGIQSSIPESVYDTFSVTGTSHILVISGWNISIIAAALYGLAERLRLSKTTMFVVILVAIWLYTFFVGATATVLRAAVMGSIVVIGQHFGRQGFVWTTLFAACWLMSFINPQVLWDMGFQLSALATASLFAFGKGVEAMLNRTFLRAGWLGWAREALTATLAAQVLALPLILYAFGNLSLIAPVANVVLLPVVPYAMLFGALALVAGLIWLPLGQAIAPLAYLFLTWLTEGARWFAQVPFAAVLIPPFPLWMLLVYYAVVLALRFGRVPAVEEDLAAAEAA